MSTQEQLLYILFHIFQEHTLIPYSCENIIQNVNKFIIVPPFGGYESFHLHE